MRVIKKIVQLWDKVRRRLFVFFDRTICAKPIGYFLYPSYWNSIIARRGKGNSNTMYYTALPNPRAGIGHQMANWNEGFWYARKFGLKFAHLPFSTETWESFLGFGEGEVSVESLLRKGYKIRKLPWFNENNEKEVNLQKKIMSSYKGEKVVFLAEQDQGYHDQYGVMDVIQNKFYSAPARKNDHLIYDKEQYSIAIHVRRGDIMTDTKNPNLTMRILTNQYFYNALCEAIKLIKTDKPIHIYFFSQGIPSDFPEFGEFDNFHWCLDMNAQQSFLHLVYADLLITSKSSFSYKPALLNKGIKICPKDFWHEYPNNKDWFLCDTNGHLYNNICGK